MIRQGRGGGLSYPKDKDHRQVNVDIQGNLRRRHCWGRCKRWLRRVGRCCGPGLCGRHCRSDAGRGCGRVRPRGCRCRRPRGRRRGRRGGGIGRGRRPR